MNKFSMKSVGSEDNVLKENIDPHNIKNLTKFKFLNDCINQSFCELFTNTWNKYFLLFFLIIPYSQLLHVFHLKNLPSKQSHSEIYAHSLYIINIKRKYIHEYFKKYSWKVLIFVKLLYSRIRIVFINWYCGK